MPVNHMPVTYDALIVVSFGGPEGPSEVMPFLENVVRGRNVPRERLLEVAEHYRHFGGKSPINDQNRALVAAVAEEFRTQGPVMPVYFGNRNWHPFLADTLRQMAADGVRRAAAFVTSAFGSFSGCRQYLDNIERAREEVGPAAPVVDKLRLFFNHPGFIEAMTDRVSAALERIPPERRDSAALIFTAHSIPEAMAATSPYVSQLREACRIVSERVRLPGRLANLNPKWRLAYQSRSGPPTQPWLGPDILDELSAQKAAGETDVAIVPIGFLSDHMEVLYDLDVEARAAAEKLGLNMIRCATVGNHPRIVRMVRELLLDRMAGVEDAENAGPKQRSVGSLPPPVDACPADCCRWEGRATR